MLTAFAVAIVLGQGQAPSPPRYTSITGNVAKIANFESKVLGNRRNLIIYLPPDYDQNRKRRYPVLYMGDGQNLMDGMTSYGPNMEWRADDTADFLIQAGMIEPLIIVGIDNAGAARADEYLPTRSTRGNRDGWGGKADDFAKFLITEVKPAIDRAYRTKRDPKNTGLGGSSFGGIMTLHIGLKHPNVFGKLIAMSPSLWWDSQIVTKRIQAATYPVRPKLWIDMGTQEDSQAVGQTLALRDILTTKGWKSGKDLWCVIEGFAPHNEFAWARRLPSALTALFPRN